MKILCAWHKICLEVMRVACLGALFVCVTECVCVWESADTSDAAPPAVWTRFLTVKPFCRLSVRRAAVRISAHISVGNSAAAWQNAGDPNIISYSQLPKEKEKKHPECTKKKKEICSSNFHLLLDASNVAPSQKHKKLSGGTLNHRVEIRQNKYVYTDYFGIFTYVSQPVITVGAAAQVFFL